MTSRTGSARRIWGIWRKWVEMRPASGEDGWFSLARGDLCGGCHTCWGGADEKSQNRKIVSLSPYVEEPLNSKVINFRTWTKKSLRVFRISRSCVLCIYVMDVPCTFCIFMYMAMVQRVYQLTLNENNSRNNFVGKVIHWELCKRLKFDHDGKWYMHQLESAQEN